MSDMSTTTTVPNGSELSGMGGQGFVPSSSPTSTDGKKYESAIGVEGQRITDTKTGKVTYEGYTGNPAQRIASSLPTPYVPTLPKVEPKYFAEDLDKFSSLSRGTIASWQMKMNAAGLLGNEFSIGVPDNATISAYREVLSTANRELMTDQQAMELLAQRKIKVGGGSITAYRLTNEADIKNVIDATAQSLLGRSLDDEQLNKMAKLFQQQELTFQRQYKAGGVVEEAPTAQQFATSTIEKDFGDEVDLRRLDSVFGAINKTLMGGK